MSSLVRQPAVIVREDAALAEAMRTITAHDIGRLPVSVEDCSGRLVGMLTGGWTLVQNCLNSVQPQERGRYW